MQDPQNCFPLLCRIVAGQQLAGAAMLAIWKRLLETVGNNLTPQSILDLVEVECDRSSSTEDGAVLQKRPRRGSTKSSLLLPCHDRPHW